MERETEKEMTKAYYFVGLLIRREFRRILEKLKWEDPDTRYKEIKGFSGSDFYVAAPKYIIAIIDGEIKRLEK